MNTPPDDNKPYNCLQGDGTTTCDHEFCRPGLVTYARRQEPRTIAALNAIQRIPLFSAQVDFLTAEMQKLETELAEANCAINTLEQRHAAFCCYTQGVVDELASARKELAEARLELGETKLVHESELFQLQKQLAEKRKALAVYNPPPIPDGVLPIEHTNAYIEPACGNTVAWIKFFRAVTGCDIRTAMDAWRIANHNHETAIDAAKGGASET